MEKDLRQNLTIRNAVPADVPLILGFIKELAEYEKMASEVTATEDILKDNLFGRNKYAEVLIAEYKGKPAGQALFFHNFSTFLGKPGIYLEDIYVKPGLRGKGIGKSLLMEVVKIAKERNCGRVEWVVLDWNEPSINFYKSLGAVPMNEWSTFRLTEPAINELLK